MKKRQTFLIMAGMVSASMLYACPATYSPSIGLLEIPGVEVPLNDVSKLLYKDVELQQSTSEFVFTLKDFASVEPVEIESEPLDFIDCVPEGTKNPTPVEPPPPIPCVSEDCKEDCKEVENGFFLKRVRKNKKLLCGGRTDLPGFGYTCPNGSSCGFDIDLCKAVAAAVLNSSAEEIISLVPISTGERKEVLNSENPKVDMVSRNVTWTTTRDAEWGNFTHTMFYDAQGFMVRRDSGISTIAELDGKRICVVSKTTTYENLKEYFKQNGLELIEILVDETSDFPSMLVLDECDAATTDKWSGLHAKLARDEFFLLEGIISKEPLTPIVPHGDVQWFNIVKMVLFALINAEELGITQDNVDHMMAKGSPQVRRLLGVEGSFGQKALGLHQEAIVQVIRAVGNYGEIYERHLGAQGINIPRTLNKLWTNGGLIYAPPIR